MLPQMRKSFSFYIFMTVSICLSVFLLKTAAAEVDEAVANYTFETIAVPGVDYLAVTASSDFEDYAGNTRIANSEKDVGFTLIDGVFTRHDFPGAHGTYFYALGNNGVAAGYYKDSEGLSHGVILENGELRQYDFPGSVETEIFGINDATGVLTGNFRDASGVRRGFSGETVIEVPGASATFAEFATASGSVVGSYIDSEGMYHAYVYAPGGRFVFSEVLTLPNLEYLFVHGVNEVGVVVVRAKAIDDVPRTYVGRFGQIEAFAFPGSVSTEGWNINQDGSVVGFYDTADGRRHGFIARPRGAAAELLEDQPVVDPTRFTYTFETIAVPGVDFLSVTASSDFQDYAGYTKSADGEKDVAFTLIDGVFMTYDFPGSENTYFYALGNNGNAAGYYEDSDGLHHGVILENGELRQYDFPGSVETEVWGISDATGALTGNFRDASGLRRGFSGETVIEVPEASATYADFVSGSGTVVGSYRDSAGTYRTYGRAPDGRFAFLDVLKIPNPEYLFVHGINDVGVIVVRGKAVDDVPRTYVGRFGQLHALHVPGSVSTEGYNINQDGSVVGTYTSADGRTHGFFARPAAADVREASIATLPPADYTFETIAVPGIDYLSVTASSDFEDYAGYTKGPDGEKDVAFTLIDGVFMTYDFPGSENTYFYALGNNGNAAGYYEDSEGRHRGIVLENGELRAYDFPNSVETEIYGISDATGALTGNWVDASGVRRGFTRDIIVEFPGATATFADFINAAGSMVGSYVDADGIFHPYLRSPDGRYISFDLANAENLEYFYVHGLTDARINVSRGKAVGDVPRTYVGTFIDGLREVRVPGSVSTEGYNINQDLSIVGHYEAADGRRHGFIARPTAISDQPVFAISGFTYTFESIDVPGVEFLALTASSDFEDYAGYTKSADGEKMVGFTLIDGVFSTYDFPGSQHTYFYALGNNGTAAGYYEDSEGRHRGVVLENGALRPYDFPGSVETEIYGISDATGALTGNFRDASGLRRGFSGETIIAYPGATATFSDFINASGALVGSYIDNAGIYRPYLRSADGRFVSFDLPTEETYEYFYVHGITDTKVNVSRAKVAGEAPRTYVGSFLEGLHELKFPGSVSTEGYNINQDASVVGHYDSHDGRRHGFIAKLVTAAERDRFSNTYTVSLTKGLNMLSVPLAPRKPMTAKSLAGLAGATVVISLDAEIQRFVAWTPSAPDEGFPIQGGKGYIVNVPEPRSFTFVGGPWRNQTAAAPPAVSQAPQHAWAFVVSGRLEGKPAFDGNYQVSVRNLRTNRVITAPVQGDYFAAATADLTRRSVVGVGDVVELRVIGPRGNVESETLRVKVTPQHLANAVVSVRLDNIGQPTQNLLLQNYPNPFNPETWIPYQLSKDSRVSISIYDTTGQLVRTLSLGFQSAGFYNRQGRAAYWDGRNALGERVASGLYFYELTTPTFQKTRRMLILK